MADARSDDRLCVEIGAAAARLIAEEGADYASAKRRAARDLLGEGIRRGVLPDNELIERELRRYLETFAADWQPRVQAQLRALALDWMRRLAVFEPRLVGAVLNGTATRASDLHLHLFTDDAKMVEIALLDGGLEFEVDEADADRTGLMETIRTLVVPPRGADLPPRVGLVLDVHETDALRVAPRHRSTAPGLHPVEALGRADHDQVAALVASAEAAR